MRRARSAACSTATGASAIHSCRLNLQGAGALLTTALRTSKSYRRFIFEQGHRGCRDHAPAPRLHEMRDVAKEDELTASSTKGKGPRTISQQNRLVPIDADALDEAAQLAFWFNATRKAGQRLCGAAEDRPAIFKGLHGFWFRIRWAEVSAFGFLHCVFSQRPWH